MKLTWRDLSSRLYYEVKQYAEISNGSLDTLESIVEDIMTEVANEYFSRGYEQAKNELSD